MQLYLSKTVFNCFEKDRSSDFFSCIGIAVVLRARVSEKVQVKNYTNRNFISTAQKHDLTKHTVSRSVFNVDKKSILKTPSEVIQTG